MKLRLTHCRIVFLFILLAISTFISRAETIKRSTLSTPLIEGTLPNGLRYILVQNSTPTHKIEMRMVMRVGSLVEGEQQKGCAHYLEHLAFEGTKHFPKRSMIQAFEAHGMKYGRDINAFTGFDRTVYSLSLPVTSMQQRTKILQLALRTANDWITNIELSKNKVSNEQGIITEELRSYILPDEFYSLKIGIGRHAIRMPLGNENNIKAVTPLSLKRYYNKWYQPQNATIIIVGDINLYETQQLLTASLSKITSTNKQATPTSYPLTYKKGFTCKILIDSLQNNQKIEWIIPYAMPFATNIRNRIACERMKIVRALLDARLKAVGVHCDVYNTWYLADKYHFTFSFLSPSNAALLQNIGAVAAECKRIIKQGVCTPELKLIIKQQQAKIGIECNDKVSNEICDDLIDYVLHGEQRISTEQQAKYIKEQLGRTTNRYIVKKLKFLLKQMQQNCLIAYTANGKKTLTQQDIVSAWKQGEKNNLDKYIFKRPSIDAKTNYIQCPVWTKKTYLSKQKAIISRQYYANIGVTDVKLSNGLRLLLRPTDITDSMIYVSWIGRGGIADLTPQQQKRYHDAIGYIDMGGIQNISTDTLATIMLQNNLSMAVGIDQYWHQLLASSPNNNSGTLLYLIREKLTHPALDTSAFENLRQSEIENCGKETLLQQLIKRDTDRMMSACIDSLVGNGANIAQCMSKADWQQLQLDTLAAYYKQTFGDLLHTTLIITGGFDIEKTIADVVDIFSDMPQQTQLPLNNMPTTLPLNKICKVFVDDNMDNKATLCIVYPFNYKPALKTSLCIKLMRDLLQEQLINVLREKMHIVYSPYVDLYYNGYPQQRAYLQLTIDTKKENIKVVEQQINLMLTQLQKQAVSIDVLNKMKQSFVVTKQQALSNNTPIEWKNALTSLIKNKEEVKDFNQYNPILQQITPKEIQQMFQQHININKPILLIKTNETEY